MSGTRTIQLPRAVFQGIRRASRAASRSLPLIAAAVLAVPSQAHSGAMVADGTWALLPFPPPSARVQHSAIYDPVRNRVIVFGGLSGASLKNDLWALSLTGTPTWAPLSATGTPPSARRGHSAIYDPVRDRMLIYGGDGGAGPLGDVWALSFSGTPAWSQVSPSGSPPASRTNHTAIYDSVRDRMVIFGGKDIASNYLADAWVLALASPAWTSLTPTGGPPAGRADHSAIYDTAHDRMVVFGGKDAVMFYDDLWSLSFASTAWSTLAPSGSAPPARWGHTAIYDSPRDRMILFGGDDGGDPLSSTVWSLAFSPSLAWSTLSPSGAPPSGRFDHVSVFDSAANRMLVFGGQAEVPVNDLFSLALSGSPAWTAISPAGGPPAARTNYTAVFDPPRNRMIVVYGQGSTGADLQDIWALTSDPNWVPISASGTPPAARDGQVMIYDPVRDRLVLFGGLGNNYFNDVWVLSLSGTPTWSQLSTTGGPPTARYAATGVYDPAGDRLVIFGGYNLGPLGDVWALTLAGGTPTWTQITPGGSPIPARFHHNAIRNPATNEMVVFGGSNGTAFLFQDTWKLNLSGSPVWTQFTPTGSPPSARYQSTMVYDSARKRGILFGGTDGSSFDGDTWSLSLTGTPAWTVLAPSGVTPSARQGMRGVYDPIGDRMLVFGGFDGQTQNDTWALSFGTPTAVEISGEAPPAPRLYAAYPNPFHAGAAIPFDLPTRAEVRVRVFDVQGRLIRELARGERPAGPNALQWDGSDAQGEPVASGTYFLSLESAGVRLTQKIVRLR